MPAAYEATGEKGSYSLVKHFIIESREARDDPQVLEHIRSQAEEWGVVELFDAAQKCINCAEGLCLLLNGTETGCKVGGTG